MTSLTIWLVSLGSIALVIIRPLKLPEYIWAVAGALLLILLGKLTPAEGFAGVSKGLDVYLFLIGMMLLAETARQEKLFDWLAAHATRLSRGSERRLFLLIYLVGVAVTTFLSNDATAVVLTPAVACAVKAAKVKDPLPYLYICAFVANAASFVLPISNPANLVIHGTDMPTLLVWLGRYIVPSAVAIVSTFVLLFITQKSKLTGRIDSEVEIPSLGHGGRMALAGIFITVGVLITASMWGVELGMPTAMTGILTYLVVVLVARKGAWEILSHISWSVLPLVAGLFVIVEALSKTGITRLLSDFLTETAHRSATEAVWLGGVCTAFLCNLMNNLPAGLVAGNVMQVSDAPEIVKSAVLIAIDMGPNLSVTGSLATILWLLVLRREGITVGAWQFLKLGVLLMTVPLILTLASLFHPMGM